MSVHVCGCKCTGGKGQRLGIDSLLSPCGTQELNSSRRASVNISVEPALRLCLFILNGMHSYMHLLYGSDILK